MPKILIAVPTFETILPETFKSIYALNTKGHDVDFDFVKGYDCARARNEIAKRAMEGNYDYVLMVDSDIIIPENTIECLLQSPVDIVYGFCPRKNTTEKKSTVYKIGKPNFEDCYLFDNLPALTRVEVKGAGAACAMIKTDIFRKLKYPWFKYVSYPNNTYLSEDLYFCAEAGKAGYVMWADTRVRCGHLVRSFQYE